ncbi:MAG: class I SAM-dependent methyltransferase [Myxococcota bacterium]
MTTAPVATPTPLSGELDLNGRRLPVELLPGSRVSLLVRPMGGAALTADANFDACFVKLGERTGKLGRCRVQLAYEGAAFPWRLQFLDDVYDVSALVTEGRVVNLLGFFAELPLVLAQRSAVSEGFRAYVADLCYDLTVYRKFFDEQDQLLQAEPPEVARQAQQVLLSRAGRELFRYLDTMLERLEALVKDLSPEQQERHGFYFRQQLWPFIELAPFMARTNLKPRGYAGDAEMMQMIYDDAWEGSSSFAKVLHKHPVEHPGAQAVRNRRLLVPKRLKEALAASSAQPFRVLSVACGPAREVEELLATAEDCRRLSLTLLDQDPEALAAARKTVERVAQARGEAIEARTVGDSVRTLLKERDLPSRLGRFHFLYSMGMFDYLTPPVAKAVLSRLYELLEPGGVALVGNYHVANRSRYYMAYWLDWNLYYRTEDEMMALGQALPGARVSVELDDSRCQMFLKVEKPRE